MLRQTTSQRIGPHGGPSTLWILTSLVCDGLRFRETGFSTPETQPPKPPLSGRPATSETERACKTPPLAGLSNAFRKSPQMTDCVVGPGVVPRHSKFNNLDCQMAVS